VLQGFTVIQGTLHPQPPRRPPRYLGENEGGRLFYNLSHEVLNPTHFQWVDKRLKYVNDKGLAMVFWFAWSDDWSNGTSGDRYKRYARYVIARYSAYNVMWGVLGEYEEIGDIRSVRDAGRFIKRTDPYKHPLTTHTVNTTADDFCNEAWIDFHGQQHKTNTIAAYNFAAVRDRDCGKPVVQMEMFYEDQESWGLLGDSFRKGGWASLTGGGFFTYGQNDVAVEKQNLTSSTAWSTALTKPGAQRMKYVRAFWDKTQWWKMAPDNSLVNNGFALRDPGKEYVIYLPTGGSGSVNLSAARGTLSAEWFNPRTGETTSTGTVTGGGNHRFTAPDTNDWILHIRNPAR
jgi:hypothetical protein